MRTLASVGRQAAWRDDPNQAAKGFAMRWFVAGMLVVAAVELMWLVMLIHAVVRTEIMSSLADQEETMR